MQGVGRLEQLFGGGANPVAFGQIDPADCAAGIQEKFGRAGYVLFTGSGFEVQQVVACDDCGIRVGEKCIGVAALGAKITRSFRGINTDGGHANAARFKIGQVMLDTP